MTSAPVTAQNDHEIPHRPEIFPGARRLLRRGPGLAGLVVLGAIFLACVLSLPWTLASVAEPGTKALGDAQAHGPRYDYQDRAALRLPPFWAPMDDGFRAAYDAAAKNAATRAAADERNVDVKALADSGFEPPPDAIAKHRPRYICGSDQLGRSLLARCLLGGAISLTIGIAAAALSVLVGTVYGALAGYVGGRVDGVMMRVVDVLYGLPYVLLVVLLAVAVDGVMDRWQHSRLASVQRETLAYASSRFEALPRERQTEAEREKLIGEARATLGTGELSAGQVQTINMVTLLVAIGGVSWLTMARVIRGQVLSLKAQPFMEASRAIGVPVTRQFTRHLLPNLVGPIVVYATLTVPQAILQESFLSFLGIGVKPPLPSWGNLAADALGELNTVRSHWWMLVFPCLLLAATLLALNFLGEGLREALDPRSRKRGA